MKMNAPEMLDSDEVRKNTWGMNEEDWLAG